MRLRLDRSERAQRFARADRALDAQHHDTACAFSENRGTAQFTQRMNQSDRGASLDSGADFDAWHKKSVVGRGMVDLQMRLIGVAGRAQNLGTQLSSSFGSHAAELHEQVLQPAVERAQVARVYVARAATLHVDGGDITVVSRTQRATRQKRSRPAPKRIEARSHFALLAVDSRFVADEAGPREQFVRTTGAVQIDIVRGLGKHLGVEKMREPLRDTAASFPWKRAGEIHVVGGRRPETGVVSRLVQDGDHDHRAAERFRAPVLGPVAQKRGAFVFVAVGGTVEHQQGTVAAAPDEQVEAYAARRNSTLVKAR